jgi:hypothetical protein
LTLDEDVAQQIRRLMRERGAGFKETVNDLLRRGLRSDDPAESYEPMMFTSGVRDGIDLDRATRIVADLEDGEVVRKVEMGK